MSSIRNPSRHADACPPEMGEPCTGIFPTIPSRTWTRIGGFWARPSSKLRMQVNFAPPSSRRLGPPVVPFYPFFGRVPLLKQTTEKKGSLILTSLLEDIGEQFEPIPEEKPSAKTKPWRTTGLNRNAGKESGILDAYCPPFGLGVSGHFWSNTLRSEEGVVNESEVNLESPRPCKNAVSTQKKGAIFKGSLRRLQVGPPARCPFTFFLFWRVPYKNRP